MKTIILHPNCASVSAKRLAMTLNADCENPFESKRRDYRNHDLVINYGCNRNILSRNIINTPKSVAYCTDKLITLSLLKRGGVKTLNFTTDKKEALSYDVCVARRELKGKQNDGMEIIENWVERKLELIPDAPLYTDYFFHKKEFRIVVLGDRVVAAYEKVWEDDKTWALEKRDYKYLLPIKEECIKAALVLGIDYAGIDVVVDEHNDFAILEVNSAPIITDDVIKSFKTLIRRYK